MSTLVVSIGEDTTVEEAARLMARKRIKKLVVVRDDELVGILTSADLVRVEPKLTRLIEELLKR